MSGAALAPSLAEGLAALPAPGLAILLLLLKGTLVLLLGFAAGRLLTRASASARHLVWVVTFSALLLLPVAAAVLPGPTLAVLPVPTSPGEGAAALPNAAGQPGTGTSDGERAGEDAENGSPASTLSAHRWPSGPVTVDGPGRTGASVPSPAVPTASPAQGTGVAASPGAAAGIPVRAGLLLLIVYLSGAVVLGGWLLVGLATVVRYTRQGRPPAPQGAWRDLADALSHRLGLERPVRLVVSERVRVPMVWGGRRPVILLPAAAESWPEAHRRDALLHELAHVRRGDWPLQLAARLVVVLHWFHPLAWVAFSRLRLEAERACDDRVLEAGTGSCDYAERLVDLARGVRLRPEAAVAMSGRSQLAARIRSLLDAGRRRAPLARRSAVALAATLVLPALALGAVDLAPPTLPPAAAEDRGRSGIGGGQAGGPDLHLDDFTEDEVDLTEADLDALEARVDAFEDGDAGVVEALFAALGFGRDPRQPAHRDDRAVADRDERLLPSLSPLMRAARRGDGAAVRERLAAGDDPNQVLHRRGTPLIHAALAGDAASVRELIAAGADPNLHETGPERPDDLPRTPLGAAARSGSRQAVTLLLDAGAEVDAAPRGDATPLMIAARHGHADLVRLLVDRGADANVVVKGDGTPLIEAARGGSREAVQILLDHGADPRVGVEKDGNPLIAAARQGDAWMVRRFLEGGADPDAWVEGDESGWFHAVAGGDPEVVRRMLDAGADPNAVWHGDGNPLMVALGHGHEEVVEILLAAGARPDLAVQGDGNALIVAAARGALEQVDRLLAAGADPDAAVRGDGNPLIAAAAAGHLDVVRRLVAAGADVDRVVPGDENPLIQAAGGGHLEVVRYLVEEADADVDVRVEVDAGWPSRREVRTPLSMARRGDHTRVVRYLRSRGATVE